MESIDELIARLKEGENRQTPDIYSAQDEMQVLIEQQLEMAGVSALDMDELAYEGNGSSSIRDHQVFPTIEKYATLIQGSPAYQKLLADVRCECLFDPAIPNTVANISGTIYAAIRTTETICTKIPPSTVQMKFKVDWNPNLFVQEQCYQSAPETALHDAITLTGSTSMGQAATCAQYLQQTWPAIGLEILELLQDFARDRGTQSAFRRLPPVLFYNLLTLGLSHSGVAKRYSAGG